MSMQEPSEGKSVNANSPRKKHVEGSYKQENSEPRIKIPASGDELANEDIMPADFKIDEPISNHQEVSVSKQNNLNGHINLNGVASTETQSHSEPARTNVQNGPHAHADPRSAVSANSSFKCHEWDKLQNINLPLTRCLNNEWEQMFCYQCIKKYQIDSFIKADFKHMLENPKSCPVCVKQCKCFKWDSADSEESKDDDLSGRKKSMRIREAKRTAKGKDYYEQIKRKNMRKQRSNQRIGLKRSKKAPKLLSNYFLTSIFEFILDCSSIFHCNKIS